MRAHAMLWVLPIKVVAAADAGDAPPVHGGDALTPMPDAGRFPAARGHARPLCRRQRRYYGMSTRLLRHAMSER